MSFSPILFFGLLASGLILLAKGLRGDPPRGRRRCPRCWYDLRGTPGMRCSECGYGARGEVEFLRRRRYPGVIAMAMLAIVSGSTALAGPWLYPHLRRLVVPRYHVAKQLDVGSYRVRLLETNFPDDFDLPRAIEIARRGQLLLHFEGFYFEIGCSTGEGPPIGIGENITGLGSPNLVITAPSGGSGGYSTSYVFQLGEEAAAGFALLAVLGTGTFRDVDADGRLEFLAADGTFRYRWTSGAASPCPHVIQRFEGDRYATAFDLMRRPPPSREQLEGEWRAVSPEDRFPLFLHGIVDLVFSGNAAMAWELIEESWPVEGPDRAQFIVEFKECLEKSPFAADLRVLQLPP